MRILLLSFLILINSMESNFLFSQTLPEIEELGLWVVYVETQNKEEPTCDVLKPPPGCSGESITNANKVPCRLYIRYGGGILYDSGLSEDKGNGATIRVRGNTSASQVEKKPYKIKLQKKADLLCRGNDVYNDKDWLLIKNWGINGLVGFKVNELLGMPFIPKFRYVNVVLNGIYKGTYLLCESIKRNTNCRINVSDSGYIFEYDAYWWKEDIYVDSDITPFKYTIKYPESEDLTTSRIDYLNGILTQVEDSLMSSYSSSALDYLTFAKWIVGHDILGSFDSSGSNVYMCKYDDTKFSPIIMPCLWDFDGIMGDDEQLSSAYANIHWHFFYQYLFKDKKFINVYLSQYDSFVHKICREMAFVIKDFSESEYGLAYRKSFEKDMSIWDFYDRLHVDKSYASWIDNTIRWFNERPEKLDNVVENLRLKNDMPSNMMANLQEGAFYNLLGSKVTKKNKGLYIIRGKKILRND